MVKLYFSVLFIGITFSANAAGRGMPDTVKADSAKQLHAVTIKGYLSDQPLLSVPASVAVLSPDQIKLQPENSLVPAMNSISEMATMISTPLLIRLAIQ